MSGNDGAGRLLDAPSVCLGRTARAAVPDHLHDDRFRPYREYTTGQVRAGSYPNLVGLELNGRIDRRSGALTTLLSVEFAYVGLHKRNYESAHNNHAQPLPLTRVASHGRCPRRMTCSYTEVFTVEIPAAVLRQAAAEGYNLKVFARHGPNAQINIPKVQIAALLARIDGDRRDRLQAVSQKPN